MTPEGGLWWPKHAVLAVADLHLEKGSAYAARGQMLPPYDTAATLRRLARLIAEYDPATVICLGDSFHDAEAGSRMAAGDRAFVQALAKRRRWIWIAGNHDPQLPKGLPGEMAGEIRLDPLIFRHEPQTLPATGEIAGHLHPCAAVAVRGRRFRRRCAASDGTRAILPAFGAFTGGLNVLDEAYRDLLPPRGFHAWMLGRDSVVPVAGNRLLPD